MYSNRQNLADILVAVFIFIFGFLTFKAYKYQLLLNELSYLKGEDINRKAFEIEVIHLFSCIATVVDTDKNINFILPENLNISEKMENIHDKKTNRSIFKTQTKSLYDKVPSGDLSLKMEREGDYFYPNKTPFNDEIVNKFSDSLFESAAEFYNTSREFTAYNEIEDRGMKYNKNETVLFSDEASNMVKKMVPTFFLVEAVSENL